MKLGFIDYYLDEYHANNYPEWIKAASGGEIEVAYAYAKIDSPTGGLTTAEWSAKYNIPIINTIEELVEKSDGIIVLSPDNPEQHEELCQFPLQSGKCVYVDKTFAETKEIAERIFALAKKHNSPISSSSALRFADEYQKIDRSQVENILSWGPGKIETYAIHQIEPTVALMGPDVSKVMFTGTEAWPSFVCEYSDGRKAIITHHGWDCPFGMSIGFKDGSTSVLTVESDFFKNCIADMVNFFRTGKASVTPEETIAVIAVIETATKAYKNPGTWVAI